MEEKVKHTNIYFIKNPKLKMIKIGNSINVDKRLQALNEITGVDLELLTIVNDVPEYFEKILHKMYIKERKNGEWFIFSKRIRRMISNLLHHQNPKYYLTKKIECFIKIMNGEKDVPNYFFKKPLRDEMVSSTLLYTCERVVL
jgi:hypothetical protein